jgi:hypothetical protein
MIKRKLYSALSQSTGKLTGDTDINIKARIRQSRAARNKHIKVTLPKLSIQETNI